MKGCSVLTIFKDGGGHRGAKGPDFRRAVRGVGGEGGG